MAIRIEASDSEARIMQIFFYLPISEKFRSFQRSEENEEGKVLKKYFSSRCRFLPFSTFKIIRSIFRLLFPSLHRKPEREREREEELNSIEFI